MAISSALVGVLRGGIGAASKYEQLGDEQRKAQMDEQKAQAQMYRQQSFARFQKQIGPSGMFAPTGRQVTEEQYGQMTPEQRSALKPTYQVETEAREAVRQEGRRGQLSQFMDKETGQVLTHGELEERGGAQAEGIVSKAMWTQEKAVEREGRAEERAEVRETAKTTKAIQKSYSSRLGENIVAIAGDREPTEIQRMVAMSKAFSNIRNTRGEDATGEIDMTPELKLAVLVGDSASDVQAGLNEGLELNEIQKGYSAVEWKKIIEFLETEGTLVKGFWGYRGIDD